MRSWYFTRVASLLSTDPASILGELSLAAATRGLPALPESIAAWRETVEELVAAGRQLASEFSDAGDWAVLLEYEIPRRARRIDAVLLARDTIFLIEMKTGARRFARRDVWQAEQYARDIRDFHRASRNSRIAPVLVATAAPPGVTLGDPDMPQGVLGVTRCASGELGKCIAERVVGRPAGAFIDPVEWDESAYQPTPSIIEAARQLYEQHDVRDISLADSTNLHGTVEAVIRLIKRCRDENRRGIAFITGAPGSGKTLAGLQVVHDRRLAEVAGADGVFLSGNMPLVEVIVDALADAPSAGATGSRLERRRRLSTFVQHAYLFRNEYAEHEEQVPPEHVLLFDEAQRAWDQAQVERWTRGQSRRSEPQIVLDVMSRVSRWCVVIAMVGGGQEINRGEAGLAEWGRALFEFHPDWLVAASPAVLPGAPPRPGGGLLENEQVRLPVEADSRLNLEMNVRSPRAERLNEWVNHLLAGSIPDAADCIPDGREFPMALTRNLETARDWLRDRAAPEDRYGLLGSADDRRLRAWGLDTRSLRQERGWANWFLKPVGDVRSSFQLEVPATAFDCQGLELDWSAVCWGSDLTPTGPGGAWRTRKFRGSAWQEARGPNRQFLINGYRVLLTRARKGQVIWVPRARPTDLSVRADYFDAVAALLEQAGVPSLD